MTETTMRRLKNVLMQLMALTLLVGAGWASFNIARAIWSAFKRADPSLAAAMIAGGTTVLAATLTVVAGRYSEKKRELASLYREKKLPIYSAFLTELFKRFQGGEPKGEASDDWAPFLRDWHLQLVLWGGPEVVSAYIKWKSILFQGPTARSILATDALILAIRKELGNKNRGLPSGLFAHMILRHPDLLLSMAKENPDVSLSQVAEKERALGLEP